LDPILVGLCALASRFSCWRSGCRSPRLGISPRSASSSSSHGGRASDFVAQWAWRPTLSLIANGPLRFPQELQPRHGAAVRADGAPRLRGGVYHRCLSRGPAVAGAAARRGGDGIGGRLRRLSAITGSSVACAAAMGRIAIPEMLKFGYSKPLAAGSVAIGGTLGSLIPPSILFILYGIFAEQSIAKLFMAAIIPGLLSLGGLSSGDLHLGAAAPRGGPDRPDEEIGADRWRAWAMLVHRGPVRRGDRRHLCGVLHAVRGRGRRRDRGAGAGAGAGAAELAKIYRGPEARASSSPR
jgi:C4-dicarboxylate transporter DctM subunit